MARRLSPNGHCEGVDAATHRRENPPMIPRFSTLVWLATRAKATSISDALSRLPATRLDVADGFVHILWDPSDWSGASSDARDQVLDALRVGGVDFELAIGTVVEPPFTSLASRDGLPVDLQCSLAKAAEQAEWICVQATVPLRFAAHGASSTKNPAFRGVRCGLEPGAT